MATGFLEKLFLDAPGDEAGDGTRVDERFDEAARALPESEVAQPL